MFWTTSPSGSPKKKRGIEAAQAHTNTRQQGTHPAPCVCFYGSLSVSWDPRGALTIHYSLFTVPYSLPPERLVKDAGTTP